MGEASKELVAAPETGYRLRVFYILATCLVAAAQVLEVGKNGGTVAEQLFVVRASGFEPVVFETPEGFLMPLATALTAKPAAAGPAWQFYIEYIIEAA